MNRLVKAQETRRVLRARNIATNFALCGIRWQGRANLGHGLRTHAAQTQVSQKSSDADGGRIAPVVDDWHGREKPTGDIEDAEIPRRGAISLGIV